MSAPIPTKPIQSVSIHYAGERGAGIPSADFSLTTFIDPANYSADELRLELANTRRAISRLYSDMLGDTPSWVQYDYEIEARVAREAEGP